MDLQILRSRFPCDKEPFAENGFEFGIEKKRGLRWGRFDRAIPALAAGFPENEGQKADAA